MRLIVCKLFYVQFQDGLFLEFFKGVVLMFFGEVFRKYCSFCSTLCDCDPVERLAGMLLNVVHVYFYVEPVML